MKLLVILESIDIGDKSSGTKGRLAFVNSLKEAKYEVEILHYSDKNITLEDISTRFIPKQKNNIFYFLSRLQWFFQRKTNTNLSPLIEKCFGFSFAYFYDIHNIKIFLKSFNIEDYDYIITMSKGASFRTFYAVLGEEKIEKKWISYIHDPYPYHFYPHPFKKKQPGFKKKEKFFKEVVLKSTYAIFPSLLLKEWMTNFFPAFKNKSIVIPHQYTNSIPEENIEFSNLVDNRYFTVLHAGNLLEERNPEFLFQAFKMFLAKFPEAINNSKLIFIGFDDKHKLFFDSVKKQDYPVVSSNAYIPFENTLWLQNNASVNVILESVSDISPFLPGKFPHCVQAKKPILLLSPAKSETRRLLRDDYPYWSEANDVLKIATIIEDLYFKWKKDTLTYNFEYLNDYFSIEYFKKQLDSILK